MCFGMMEGVDMGRGFKGFEDKDRGVVVVGCSEGKV